MTDPTCPHCGTAIGEHEANACLNAWVATSLFGWVDTWVAHERSGGVPKVYANLPERQRDYVAIECPPYSTSISAAWEVLEWLRDKDCDVALCSAGATWLVESNVLGVTVRSESALLAICRAAVLANEKEKT